MNYLNLLDNIILPSIRDDRREAGKPAQKAEKLMERMGIGDLGQRGVTQVSGGQLQRAGICRALILGTASFYISQVGEMWYNNQKIYIY